MIHFLSSGGREGGWVGENENENGRKSGDFPLKCETIDSLQTSK